MTGAATQFPEVRKVLRYFDDFPKPGIRFIDVNPIMAVPAAREEVLSALVARYAGRGLDAVAGLEARGYYFAIPLAIALKLPFIPLRKPGKLPGEVIAVEYGKGERTRARRRDFKKKKKQN
jgi:adenine phosphoribosyltransferase